MIPVQCGRVALVLVLASTLSPAQSWTSFTAIFKRTVQTTVPAGSPLQDANPVTELTRAADGSELTLWRDATGAPLTGHLWQAGKTYILNYAKSQALIIGSSQHHYGTMPAETHVGTATILGLKCTIYPLQVANGHGSFCLDTTDQLIVRKEIYGSGGRSYLEELTSIVFYMPPLASIDVLKDFSVVDGQAN